MLPIEYQNHARSILLVSAAQLRATGKLRSGAVKRHPRVKAAAAISGALTRSAAPYKKKQAEAWAREDIEGACFRFVRRLYKDLKKQGLVFLPGAVGVVVPVIAAAAPNTSRRSVLTGVGAIAFLGTSILTPTPAAAHHDQPWLAVKPFLVPFIESMRDEVVAIITGKS